MGRANASLICAAEEWRPAPGYEGRYEVSSLGRIRSLDHVQHYVHRGVSCSRRFTGRVLNPMTHEDGYLQVSLRIGKKMRTVRLHRLVALAFHGPGTEVENEVAHLDGNPANARADNLKWCSKLENQSHKYLHGTNPAGERHPAAKLTDAAVIAMRASRLKPEEAAHRYDIKPGTARDILSGRSWRHLPLNFDVPQDDWDTCPVCNFILVACDCDAPKFNMEREHAA